MSLLVATQITAVATAVLALFAIVTGAFAILAFKKQSKEVADEAEELRLLRLQLDEQRKINEKQIGVLELEAQELRESLDERKREAEERRQGQAAKVAAWFTDENRRAGPVDIEQFGAVVRNASDLPILGVRVFFHFIQERPGGDWEPILRGGPADRVPVIAPHHDEFVEIPSVVTAMVDGISKDMYAVSVEFTDAAGNKWERDARGALIPRS